MKTETLPGISTEHIQYREFVMMLMESCMSKERTQKQSRDNNCKIKNKTKHDTTNLKHKSWRKK